VRAAFQSVITNDVWEERRVRDERRVPSVMKNYVRDKRRRRTPSAMTNDVRDEKRRRILPVITNGVRDERRATTTGGGVDKHVRTISGGDRTIGDGAGAYSPPCPCPLAAALKAAKRGESTMNKIRRPSDEAGDRRRYDESSGDRRRGNRDQKRDDRGVSTARNKDERAQGQYGSGGRRAAGIIKVEGPSLVLSRAVPSSTVSTPTGTVDAPPSPIIDVDDEDLGKRRYRRRTVRYDPSKKEAARTCHRNGGSKTKQPTDDESVAVVINATPGPRRSMRRAVVRIKMERPLEGIIACPSCGNCIVADGGCNVVTCLNHKPHFFYFCCFCGTECMGGISTCGCRRRNDSSSRIEMQEKRNEENKAQPLDLTNSPKESKEKRGWKLGISVSI